MTVFVLAFVVLVLCVAVAALQRQIATIGRRIEPEARWPFRALQVGQTLPAPLLPISAFSGFVLVCSDDIDALGAAFSVRATADEWNLQMAIVVGETSNPTGWTTRLADATRDDTTELLVNAALIRDLRPTRLPVCAYLQDGRVLDATIALSSPSSIAQRLQYVASPATRGTNARRPVWT